MPCDSLPGVAAIVRNENSAARPATVAAPGFDIDLPRPSKQRVRVVWIHRKIGRAGVLIHKEHAFPRFAAIFRAIDASFRLWSVAGTESSNEYHFVIMWIDDDAPHTDGCL